VQYSRYKTDLDQAAFTDAKDYTNTSKNLMLGGGFVYHLSNTSITGNYLYNTATRDLLEDSVYGQTYYADHYYGKSQYAEVFASTKLSAGFTLLNGADFRYASMNENGLSGTYPLGFKDTSVSQTSMYSSLLYTGNSGISIELGGRLNTHSRYGSNYTYTFNPAWLFSKNWKIYASVASGFKAPSLYELYGAFVGNPDLQPEKSVNYEAGLQYNDERFNSRVTYFNRTINDGLDYNYFTNQYYNYNQEKDQGIEWENKIQLTKILSLTANYTWLQVRELTQSRVTYNDTSYAYALRRPANTINFTVGVQPLDKIFFSLSGHYESKRYDVGGYDAYYNPLPDVDLASFFILNAYAEYKPSKMLKLFLDAKNITNKKFFTIYGYNSIPALFVAGLSIQL
jgi:vitamin B12 transporter